jgi:hypothetical protein
MFDFIAAPDKYKKLSDSEIQDIMLAYENMLRTDPLFAKNFLTRVGIINDKNELVDSFQQKLQNAEVISAIDTLHSIMKEVNNASIETNALKYSIQKNKEHIEALLERVHEDNNKVEALKDVIRDNNAKLYKLLRIKSRKGFDPHIAQTHTGQWWYFGNKPVQTAHGWECEDGDFEQLWLKTDPVHWQHSLFSFELPCLF